MKSRLQYNDIEIYSTQDKGESIVAERSIKTLKKSENIWVQYEKNVYIDKLDDIFNKYNNIWEVNKIKITFHFVKSYSVKQTIITY